MLGWVNYLLFLPNFNFLHNSQWITLPTCLVLYFVPICCIMWLIVSFLSPHNLYLLFCNILSILALIWLVLIIFSNPSTRAGYDTRSFSKRSLTGLNSEFSFSKTSWLVWLVLMALFCAAIRRDQVLLLLLFLTSFSNKC